MSYYLCFQQPPWTAGYLAGWPSLLRILNFSLTLKLLLRKQIFSQLKKAKVRQLCLEDIRTLQWHDSITFSIFENEFVSPAMVSTSFWRRRRYRWWMWRGRWWSSPAAGRFLESWDYYSLSLMLGSLRVGCNTSTSPSMGFGSQTRG